MRAYFFHDSVDLSRFFTQDVPDPPPEEWTPTWKSAPGGKRGPIERSFTRFFTVGGVPIYANFELTPVNLEQMVKLVNEREFPARRGAGGRPTARSRPVKRGGFERPRQAPRLSPRPEPPRKPPTKKQEPPVRREAPTAPPRAAASKAGGFAQCRDSASLRSALLSSKEIPLGLRLLAEDTEIWSVYRPTGGEIDRLLAAFGPCGDGTKALWQEAVRLIRLFSGR